MFTCKLDSGSRTPLCDQLYTALKNDLKSGRIAPGAKLPSKRQLSDHLHISTATVEAAYARLVSEGLCDSRPRSGVYAAEDAPRPASLLHGDVPPVQYDFSTGAADAEHFPYATWAKLMREVLSDQDKALLLSGDPQGSLELRRQIAAMLRSQRGIEAETENIVLGAGTEVLAMVLVALIGRDRLFAVEDPGYSRVRRILVASGARIAPTLLDEGAIDVRALYVSGAGAAYVTPSHQFPTGEEMNLAQREALLRWAQETGGYILEDDYDSEFCFAGSPAASLTAMDTSGHVIYMNTFSRTLCSGLRISFMVLPAPLAAQYRAMHAACSVPGFEQETLTRFMAGGYLERHIARMRVIYRSRMQMLVQKAEELGLGEVASCRAGLHVLLRVGGRTPAHELIARAQMAGVRLTRLCDYGVMRMQPQHERVVLLGFAGMDEEQIDQGLRALYKAWM